MWAFWHNIVPLALKGGGRFHRLGVLDIMSDVYKACISVMETKGAEIKFNLVYRVYTRLDGPKVESESDPTEPMT